jgi:hypothetical protein
MTRIAAAFTTGLIDLPRDVCVIEGRVYFLDKNLLDPNASSCRCGVVRYQLTRRKSAQAGALRLPAGSAATT